MAEGSRRTKGLLCEHLRGYARALSCALYMERQCCFRCFIVLILGTFVRDVRLTRLLQARKALQKAKIVINNFLIIMATLRGVTILTPNKCAKGLNLLLCMRIWDWLWKYIFLAAWTLTGKMSFFRCYEGTKLLTPVACWIFLILQEKSSKKS